MNKRYENKKIIFISPLRTKIKDSIHTSSVPIIELNKEKTIQRIHRG